MEIMASVATHWSSGTNERQLIKKLITLDTVKQVAALINCDALPVTDVISLAITLVGHLYII